MANETCMTCFYHLSIIDKDTDCICTYGGGLGKYIDHANTFCCDDYENKEGHVYTLEEVSGELLSFCNDLIDENIYYSIMQKIPTEEELAASIKRYRTLADRLRELGVVL